MLLSFGTRPTLTGGGAATKQKGGPTKPFSWFGEDNVKRTAALIEPGQTRGAIMLNIINILYREYCLARLNEMRQYELTR